MAADLSKDPVNALAPTGQGGGNVTDSRERAFSAPGSDPAAVNAGDKFGLAAPQTVASDFTAPNREHGEGDGGGHGWDDVSGQSWGPGG